MQIIVGQELDIIDAKTQEYIATVKVIGVREWNTEYPIQCLVLEKFKANGVHFYHGDYISFNKDGYWQGKNHPQANEFDMRLVIPQKGKSQNVKDILVEAYAEGIIDVVHDVEKALKLIVPHLESGKLTLEMLNMVIRRAYEN
ncbi:hypothetical protein Shy_0030 [Escherichia coli phage vB_EcoM_Shy]|uniref:Uncharacterized protein n=1 Tax=Escherichia coli phage vB_EcoM_Shy TaxID=2769805 RepID=A0A7H0XB82_9CAUD|nr:hypothetical protein Shy_0030 [Escherichia coli phage vB_EcoM_Shy]